jgi:hypothetical protein
MFRKTRLAQNWLKLETLEVRDVPALFPLSASAVAISPDDGGIPTVQFVDSSTNSDLGEISAYESSFRGGVHTALGDVTGDGVRDIVLSPGLGGGPRIRIIDGANGNTLKDSFVYEPRFTGGINVALGDVNDDGHADIITGTGVGGGPRIRVLDGNDLGETVLNDFFAYEDSFRGGVLVATGDVNDDGISDIVAGTGVGGGPRVRVLDGKSLGGDVLDDYFAYDDSFRGGVNVAVGDVNGDGISDIITGTGVGGGPIVRMRSGVNGEDLGQFLADDASFRGGVRVSSRDVNGDGSDDILAHIRHGNDDGFRVFDGTNQHFVGASSRVVDDSPTPHEATEHATSTDDSAHAEDKVSSPTSPVTGTTSQLEGKLLSLDLTTKTATIQLEDGTTRVITVGTGTEIKRDKVVATLDTFVVGEKVEALIGPNGTAWEIEAKSVAFVEGQSGRGENSGHGNSGNSGNAAKTLTQLKGTITALDATASTVTLQLAGGSTSVVKYNAATKIERNGQDSTFTSLIVGDTVEAKVDSDNLATQVEATAAVVPPTVPPSVPPVTPATAPVILTPTADSKLEAEITAIDLAAKTITVQTADGKMYLVTVKTSTKYRRNDRNSTLAALQVGDAGSMEIGKDVLAKKIEVSRA